MRIDSAILTNAIITASSENPIVSGSSQVNLTATTGYAAYSSSVKTYTDAKVAGLVDSAPGTLDTLNELAAALGDDPNVSASFATTVGTKLPTATHTAFSSSNASALRTEYKAGDTALSSSAASALRTEYVASTAALSASAHTRREQISASLDATIDALDSLGISTDTERGALSSSAHTQREAIKGLATSANNSLSSSKSAALRTEYKAGDTALSSSAHTQREAIKGLATSANNSLSSSKSTALRAEYVAGDAALSASAHTQRAAIDAKVGALDSTYATDASVTSLSSSAHTQREAIKGLATTANNTLSGSSAGALRTEYKAGDTALSSSAHTQREAIKGLATTANNSLSGSSAGALRTEYKAGDTALSASAHTRRNQLHALQLLSSSVGATINDNAVKLSGIESGATADQSAAEILTAIKTVDGASSGLDADTLDGQEGAFYAPSASMKTYVDAKVAGVVDSAPAALNTLNELAAALGDDANFATTTATSIGEKLVIASNLSDLANAATARTNLGVDAAGTVNYTLPEATATVRGGIELFSNTDQTTAANSVTTTANRTYGIQLNSDGQAVVNVPWSDTDTNTQNTKGIADGNVLSSDGNIADNDFLRINGTEVEGLTAAETRTALNVEDGATADQTAAEIRTLVGTGNNGVVPGEGSAGEFLKHDGTFGTPSYIANTDTVDMGDGFIIASSDGTDQFTITENEEVRFAGSGATSVSFDSVTQKVTISSTDTNTQLDAAGIRTAIGSGNNGHVPTVGTAGHFLKHDGTFGLPSYTTNTDVDVSVANLTARMPQITESFTIGDATDVVVTCAGSLVSTGDVTAFSDERLKKDVSTIENALDKTKQLRGVSFTKKADDSKSIGVIAQELEKVLPELVKTGEDGMKSVNYAQITGLLIEAVKELSAKVDELEK